MWSVAAGNNSLRCRSPSSPSQPEPPGPGRGVIPKLSAGWSGQAAASQRRGRRRHLADVQHHNGAARGHPDPVQALPRVGPGALGWLGCPGMVGVPWDGRGVPGGSGCPRRVGVPRKAPSLQEDPETARGGTAPGRMLAGATRGAKLVTLSPSRNVKKEGGRLVTRRINKVSSRFFFFFSQGENQREKYLPCVTQ